MALFKRKDKDGKRKGENAIGKIIYGFLLFMPLLSITARSLYVVFNKNAYESYSGVNGYEIKYKYNTNEVNQISDLITNNIYTFTLDNNNYPTNQVTAFYCSFITFDYIDTVEHTKTMQLSAENEGTYFIQVQMYSTTSWSYLKCKNSETNNTYFEIQTVRIDNINFAYTYGFNADYITWVSESSYNEIEGIEISNEGTLDNVFEYSIEKTQESNIYNWAKNTGTYTVLQTTTNGIGITNEFIPMLMAYWLLISVIYFIFDIALILVWAVHDKIHELKDAI